MHYCYCFLLSLWARFACYANRFTQIYEPYLILLQFLSYFLLLPSNWWRAYCLAPFFRFSLFYCFLNVYIYICISVYMLKYNSTAFFDSVNSCFCYWPGTCQLIQLYSHISNVDAINLHLVYDLDIEDSWGATKEERGGREWESGRRGISRLFSLNLFRNHVPRKKEFAKFICQMHFNFEIWIIR